MPHGQRDRVRGDEQRQHLQRLRRHREPQQAAVDRDREEAQQRVGQRVLAEQRAPGARPSAGRTRRPTPMPTRAAGARSRTPAPAPAGRASPAVRPSGSRLSSSASSSVRQMKSGLTGSSSWSEPRGMIMAAPPVAAAAAARALLRRLRRRRLGGGLGPRRQLHADRLQHQHVAHAVGRGQRHSAMRAKPESARRSTVCDRGHRQARRVDAVDAAGGAAGRRPARRHWPAMKRSSSAPPCAGPPKATLRAPVRVFSTGIAGVAVGQQRHLATTAGRPASPGRARRRR